MRTDTLQAPADLAGGILEGYAARGVFRGFSRGPAGGGRAVYRLLWHRDRLFELILDARRGTLRIPAVLPDVPDAMYQAYIEFVASRQSADLPPHRRIDPQKVRLRCTNRAGTVSVSATVLDGDFEYGVRKLIHLVHETFMAFLIDGPYFEYMVEAFGLDPDKP